MSEEHIFLRLVKEGKIEFTEDGKLIGFNEYAVILPVRVLNKLFVLLKENFGENKAIDILKELGRFQIKQALQRYLKTLGWEELPKNKILEFGKLVTVSLGLGNYDFVKKNDFWSISTKSTPLAEEFLLEYGKQDKPVDYYITGAYESFFSSIEKKPMICEEVKCYAKGDECCEFIIKPKEETSEK